MRPKKCGSSGGSARELPKELAGNLPATRTAQGEVLTLKVETLKALVRERASYSAWSSVKIASDSFQADTSSR